MIKIRTRHIGILSLTILAVAHVTIVHIQSDSAIVSAAFVIVALLTLGDYIIARYKDYKAFIKLRLEEVKDTIDSALGKN